MKTDFHVFMNPGDIDFGSVKKVIVVDTRIASRTGPAEGVLLKTPKQKSLHLTTI